MDRRIAKELLHIEGWMGRVAEILAKGEDAYFADDLLQEAGDSLMMKLGEAANRLARLDLLAPDGVVWADAVANRNFIIHQYDEIDREISWTTLSQDLPAFGEALASLIDEANALIDAENAAAEGGVVGLSPA